MTTVKATARPLSGLFSTTLAKTVAITTVIGPVGPEIWAGVPPHKAAKNPTITAP